jgi:hypothetical protein
VGGLSSYRISTWAIGREPELRRTIRRRLSSWSVIARSSTRLAAASSCDRDRPKKNQPIKPDSIAISLNRAMVAGKGTRSARSAVLGWM